MVSGEHCIPFVLFLVWSFFSEGMQLFPLSLMDTSSGGLSQDGKSGPLCPFLMLLHPLGGFVWLLVWGPPPGGLK